MQAIVIAIDALSSPKEFAISFKLGSLELDFVKPGFQFHSLSSCKSFTFNVVSLAFRARLICLAQHSGRNLSGCMSIS